MKDPSEEAESGWSGKGAGLALGLITDTEITDRRLSGTP
jgi:hypothetical protein